MKIAIKAIETDTCVFIKGDYCAQLLFDGKLAQPTFSKDGWLKLDKKPFEAIRLIDRPRINPRFQLIDPKLKSRKTPLTFKCQDVAVYSDYSWRWVGKYEDIEHLYELVTDAQEPLKEQVEFTWKVICTVPKIEEYEKFGYTVDRTRFSHEGTREITNADVSRPILDTILFPEPVLPSRPSMLTSKQSYDIIRKHVQLNIDPKVAHITSDYDFCFTVKKRVALAKPYEVRTETKTARSKSYSPPRFDTRMYVKREVEVFEMTHLDANYAKYTPIAGFKGANEGELKSNIDAYLKDLMTFINKPLVECKCCQGVGVVEQPTT